MPLGYSANYRALPVTPTNSNTPSYVPAYLLLLNFGLCVVVNGLLGIRQILSPVLNVSPLKHHAGTAGQDQPLAKKKTKQNYTLKTLCLLLFSKE